MDLSNARVVVLGGAGFIGSHVVEELLKDAVREVVVFDSFTRGTRANCEAALRDPRVSLVEGDITHSDVLQAALRGADAVVHLAALWLLHCQEYPRAAFQVNVEGTFNVLDACVRHGIKKLVFSSSASVYGDAVSLPMTEEHPLNNRTFYGATKVAGEQMCRAYYERYHLDYLGLRYMNVYGPRQDDRGAYTSVIMKMLDCLDRGEPPVVHGDGSQTYDFVYVTDTARANVLALKSNATDIFYNVGSDQGTSIRELGERLLRLSGSREKLRFEAAGRTFVTRRIGSTDRARKEIGFEARVPLEEGLARLIEWRRRSRGPESMAR